MEEFTIWVPEHSDHPCMKGKTPAHSSWLFDALASSSLSQEAPLIEELLAFTPRGGVDDQVDAFCQGVIWIETQFWRGRGYAAAPVPMVFSR